ncbi:MAG: glucose-6-phosphate isomerase [Alcanivoracaceae bacterium]|nr:glucose-6-phosphate isomerase [Alcanivoracaceae bacterium]
MSELPDTVCPSSTRSWQRLGDLGRDFSGITIRDLFGRTADRFSRFSLDVDGLLLDYSKQRLDTDVFQQLLELASECQFQDWRTALFSEAHVNASEQRAAGHWRLRDPQGHPQVAHQLQRLEILADRVHQGHWRGVYGDVVTDVVNIGVGGSELGPLMASLALQDESIQARVRPRVHFVSGMDGSQLGQLLETLNPRQTLFLVSSKSFSTVDTLSNAATARDWLSRHLGEGDALLRCHFVGVSAHPEKMTAWGIPVENQLTLWDWVGGRFSLWSSIGLPVALAAGFPAFMAMLDGAREMDSHFRHADPAQNLPLVLALIDIWNVNFLDIRARAVLPYDGRLKGLPVYLEQLEMESNGKSVDRQGNAVSYHTCPVIWGEVGPNAQHAFYQLLHQGTQPVACEFVAVASRQHRQDLGASRDSLAAQHRLSLANCLAQSRLLAFGDSGEGELEKHQRYRGNQPCSTIMMDDLSPTNLGRLIAAYEHKVFAAAVIWGINPFDQWGVELGKVMSGALLPVIEGEESPAEGLDSSTEGLLGRVRR